MNVTIWIASLDEMLRFQNKVVQRKVHVKGGWEIYPDHLKEFLGGTIWYEHVQQT